MFMAMSDVTRILSQLEAGDPRSAEKLLPLVYEKPRKLAAMKLAQQKPGQTPLRCACSLQNPGGLIPDSSLLRPYWVSSQRWKLSQ